MIGSTSDPRRLRLSEWRPEIAFVIVTTAAGIWARGRWLDPVGDSGSWWSVIYRLANGEVLYRDVYLQFGPLSPYVLAFGARLVGVSSTYVLLASWVPAIVAGVLLLRVGRPLLTELERFAVAGLLIAVSLFAPGAGRLVLPYAPAAVHALAFSCGALLLLKGWKSGARNRAFGAGALAGLAFCSKQEIGVAMAAALATTLIERSRSAVAWVGRCAIGFLLVVVPAAVFVFASAPIESLRASHLWPVVPRPPQEWDYLYRVVAGVAASGWQIQYLESVRGVAYYLALLGLLGVFLSREWGLRRVVPCLALLALALATGGRRSFLTDWFHPIALSMAVSFLLAVIALVRRDLRDRVLVCAIGVFAGLAAARAGFSNNLGGHYSAIAHFATSLAWVIFVCGVFPLTLLEDGRAATWMRRSAAVLIAAISWFGVIGSIRSLASLSKEGVQTEQGRVWVEKKYVGVYEGVRRNVRQGETVMVVPEVNGVDALFRLRDVSPYVSHVPGWLDQEGERNLIARLQRTPPDTVVVFNREISEFGREPFGVGWDRLLAAWIRTEYRIVESSRGGTIYRRPASVEVGTLRRAATSSRPAPALPAGYPGGVEGALESRRRSAQIGVEVRAPGTPRRASTSMPKPPGSSARRRRSGAPMSCVSAFSTRERPAAPGPRCREGESI